MRKVLFSMIMICVVGFIGYWITTLVYDHTTYPNNSMEFDDTFYLTDDYSPEGWNFSSTLNNRSFSAKMKANPNLELDLSGVNAKVCSYGGDEIDIQIENENSNDFEINFLRIGDDYSKIEIIARHGLFSVGECYVDINVPDKILDSLSITQGSGVSDIDGICAKENDIDIGSGELMFKKVDSFTAEKICIDLGSGNADFSGMSAENYDINVRSGYCNVSGLTGTGNINMGSGRSTFEFSDSPNGSLRLSSGYVKIFTSPDCDAELNFKISSGSVNILGENGNLFHNDGKYLLGKGANRFDITVGSGMIEIETQQ